MAPCEMIFLFVPSPAAIRLRINRIQVRYKEKTIEWGFSHESKKVRRLKHDEIGEEHN